MNDDPAAKYPVLETYGDDHRYDRVNDRDCCIECEGGFHNRYVDVQTQNGRAGWMVRGATNVEIARCGSGPHGKPDRYIDPGESMPAIETAHPRGGVVWIRPFGGPAIVNIFSHQCDSLPYIVDMEETTSAAIGVFGAKFENSSNPKQKAWHAHAMARVDMEQNPTNGRIISLNLHDIQLQKAVRRDGNFTAVGATDHFQYASQTASGIFAGTTG